MIRRMIPGAAMVTMAALAACGHPGDAGQSQRETRVVPALAVALESPAQPGDRQLRLRVSMSALSDGPDPVDHIEVHQDVKQIGIKVWVRERIPAPNEPVSNSARSYQESVSLDQPVGTAVVVDLAANPATTLPESK
jgi:hypothetical protein